MIAHAPTRREAVRKLAHALERARVHGPVTNRDLLVRTLRHPEFTVGRMDTGFYGRHLAELTAPPRSSPWRPSPPRSPTPKAAPPSAAGATCPPSRRPRPTAASPTARSTRSTTASPAPAWRPPAFPGVRLLEATGTRVVLEDGGIRRTLHVAAYGDRVHVDTPHAGSYAFTALPRFPDPAARAEPGSLLAPMPGTVVRVADGLAVGRTVTAGQPLLWLEAMKMEHRITAPASGTLTALHAAPGRQVEVGALLAVVTETEETPA
ncbi:hypothetical protein GCM10020000_32980 [Streptomyces olivoverticillatus]